ncbi:hypothetical protein N866_15605, partial [Actinotalea ferrariae CF5-4]
RAVADRREGLARLAGQVAARRSRVEAAEAEIGRLRESVGEAERRGHEATVEFAALESRVAGAEEGEEGLDAEHEAAVGALEAAVAELARLKDAEQAADKDRATWAARVDALEMSLVRKDGAGALLASDDLPGLLGSVAALVSVRPGYEDALTAALGAAADAVAVESLEVAVDALRRLRSEDAGRASLVVGTTTGPATPATPAAVRDLPEGAVPALDLVQVAAPLADAARVLLADVVVVEDLAHARALVTRHPDLTAVTRAGDLLGSARASGGSASAPSALELQAALDDARDRLADAVARGERTRFELQTARATEVAAREHHDATLERLHESDAALAAVAEQLGHLGSVARSARAEVERAQKALEAAGERLATDQAELAELAERLEHAEQDPEESDDRIDDATTERERTAAEASAARARETEARLTLRTSEERARALAGRAQSLERA